MAVPNKQEWMNAFQHIFSELSTRPLPSSSYLSFTARNPLNDSRKGRAFFQCPNCNRTWESQNGVIDFEYRLKLNSQSRRGHGDVTLWAFGQKCQRCSGCPYVPAKFAPESIDDALQKLLLKVKEKFYNEDISTQFANLALMPRAAGRGVHDTSRCQACALGRCASKQSRRGRSAGPSRGNSRRSTPGPVPANDRIQWILKFSDNQNRANARRESTPAVSGSGRHSHNSFSSDFGDYSD